MCGPKKCQSFKVLSCKDASCKVASSKVANGINSKNKVTHTHTSKQSDIITSWTACHS